MSTHDADEETQRVVALVRKVEALGDLRLVEGAADFEWASYDRDALGYGLLDRITRIYRYVGHTTDLTTRKLQRLQALEQAFNGIAVTLGHPNFTETIDLRHKLKTR